MTLGQDDVAQSYGRCCNSEGFFDDFYDAFLKSSPKIAPMFAKTDMAKQKQLLRSGISMLLMYSKGGNIISEKTMERLGASHSRNGYNVTPDLYPFWVKSLLETIKKHDKKFSPELEAAWKQELNKGISYLCSKY
jgi:hemoglobin-like flavoprotein